MGYFPLPVILLTCLKKTPWTLSIGGGWNDCGATAGRGDAAAGCGGLRGWWFAGEFSHDFERS